MNAETCRVEQFEKALEIGIVGAYLEKFGRFLLALEDLDCLVVESSEPLHHSAKVEIVRPHHAHQALADSQTILVHLVPGAWNGDRQAGHILFFILPQDALVKNAAKFAIAHRLLALAPHLHHGACVVLISVDASQNEQAQQVGYANFAIVVDVAKRKEIAPDLIGVFDILVSCLRNERRGVSETLGLGVQGRCQYRKAFHTRYLV